jgi:hypothetical protein
MPLEKKLQQGCLIEGFNEREKNLQQGTTWVARYCSDTIKMLKVGKYFAVYFIVY